MMDPAMAESADRFYHGWDCQLPKHTTAWMQLVVCLCSLTEVPENNIGNFCDLV